MTAEVCFEIWDCRCAAAELMKSVLVAIFGLVTQFGHEGSVLGLKSREREKKNTCAETRV